MNCSSCGAEDENEKCSYCRSILVKDCGDLPKGILILRGITVEQWVRALEYVHETGQPILTLIGNDCEVEYTPIGR